MSALEERRRAEAWNATCPRGTRVWLAKDEASPPGSRPLYETASKARWGLAGPAMVILLRPGGGYLDAPVSELRTDDALTPARAARLRRWRREMNRKIERQAATKTVIGRWLLRQATALVWLLQHVSRLLKGDRS